MSIREWSKRFDEYGNYGENNPPLGNVPYVYSDYIPASSRDYLTAGKKYKLLDIRTNPRGEIVGGDIRSDDGEIITVYTPESAHLDYEPWSITYRQT